MVNISKNEIRWGIIGCGDVTEVKSGPAFQKAEGSKLVAVMRRNGELAKDYALRHNVEKWYDNTEELINDPDVDAVYIATPPSSHKQYTIAVAKTGKPVYVEKPMALSTGECKEMVDVCKENNVPLFVAYYRRALPRFLKVKSLIDEGAIGEVRFVNVTFHQKQFENDIKGEKHWRVDPSIAGGGYFYDLAPHSIDLLQYYLGNIKFAKGFYSNQSKLYEAEDIVSAVCLIEPDIHISMVWNFNAYEDLDRTEIVGSKGKIRFSTFENNPVVLETKNGEKKFNIKHPEHIQQPLIQSVVDELRGIGKCVSTGQTGLQTNCVMDMIFDRIDS